MGIGLLASSMGMSDAKAARVEYYATVGEPLCDMNFVKSGLGYCDVAAGTGVKPPRGELINVRFCSSFFSPSDFVVIGVSCSNGLLILSLSCVMVLLGLAT